MKIQAGDRFGRLTTIKIISKTKNNANRWLCECDCGNETEVVSYNLTNGHTRSCGCFRVDLNSTKLTSDIKTTIKEMMIKNSDEYQNAECKNKEFIRGQMYSLLKIAGSSEIFSYEEYNTLQKEYSKTIH